MDTFDENDYELQQLVALEASMSPTCIECGLEIECPEKTYPLCTTCFLAGGAQ